MNAEPFLYTETIRSIQDAISRARLAWLTGLIVTFVYFGGLYNQTAGYTDALIARRDLAIRILETNLIDSNQEEMSKKLGGPPEKFDFFIRAREGHAPELSAIYNSPNLPGPLRAQRIAELLRQIRLDRDELAKRRWFFDVISIPGTSIQATTSDLGILGTLALAIVGFWLLANLLNEKDALLSLLGARKDKAGQWSLKLDAIMPVEYLRRAYEPITNTFVFSASEKNLVLDSFDLVSFLSPVVMTIGTVVLDGFQLQSKGLWAWHATRWGISALLATITAGIWIKCFSLNATTTRVLRLWNQHNRDTDAQQALQPGTHS